MKKLPKKTKWWLYANIIVAGLLIVSIILENIGFKGFLTDQVFRLINSVLAVTFIGFLFVLAILLKENIVKFCRNIITSITKSNASKSLMAAVIIIFAIITVFGTFIILGDIKCPACNVYKAIGFIIMMLWSCIFLCYFIWAVYFYNLNLGKTNEEWTKIKEAKQNRSKGLPYNQKDIDEEPTYNPYKEETFGLPGGTVRGMIAFTLLFGAIAMLIVSFGMDNEVTPGSFFWDQFDFYKKAFLMMIAFYFGTRSLQYLTNKTGPTKVGGDGANQQNELKTGADESLKSDILQTPPKKGIVVINQEAGDEPRDKDNIPPIVATDPMAPKK